MNNTASLTSTQNAHAALSAPESWRGGLAKAMAVCLACCIPLLAVMYSIRHLKESWDDGVITAAFARTLAHTGHLSLTPGSIPVEATSSLAWTAILTIPAFFTTNPWAVVVWMKICAGLAFAGCLYALYKLAQRFLADNVLALLSVVLFALCITPSYETFNGMEMNFYALLTLLLTLALTQKVERFIDTIVAIGLASLILLTRSESPALLLFLLAGIWLSQRRSKQLLLVAASIAFVFLAITLWRHAEFHEWVPNTIYAKRWAPYTRHRGLGVAIHSRASAIKEIFVALGWPILLAVGAFLVALLRRKPGHSSANDIKGSSIFASVTVGALFLSLVLGSNWGHPGRMVLAYLPFILLLCIAVISYAFAGSPSARLVAIGVLIAGQATCWAMEVHADMRTLSIAPIYEIEPEGLLPERVRLLLGKESLSLLLPDVGAPSLCCERLRVYDSGLLANAELAEHGWAVFPAYFRQLHPDVVITHDVWSWETHIYELPEFADYGMVGGYGVRAYVRSEIYRQLIAKGVPEVPVANAPDCLRPTLNPPGDAAQARMRRTCLDLSKLPQ